LIRFRLLVRYKLMMNSALLILTAALQGATATECRPCEQSKALIAAGDTAGAVAVLREAATEDAPAVVWGEYGMLLAQTAPVNPLDFRQRREAKSALERALDADYRNPRWLFGFSLLMRKRGGLNDAKRVLGRAVGEVEDESRDLENEDRARIYLEHARSVEEYVNDYEGYLPLAHLIPKVSPSCAARGRFCMNFARPKYFHERLFLADPPDMMRDDREQMWSSFENAFRLHPASSPAAAGLLGRLSRDEQWQEFLLVAEQHIAANDTSGWAYIFKGAGLFRNGAPEEAERSFRAGLARMEPAEREVLTDLTDIVLKDIAELMEEMDWDELGRVREHIMAISDPMQLTRVNERALEHWTRVALSELWFGDPLSGRRGYESEPGQILIRYGPPRWIRQIAGNSIHGRTGRTIFWTYTRDQPSFIFEKNAGWRRMRHSFDTYSRDHAEELRNAVPSVYRPPWLRELPHQVVRFKGERAATNAEIYFQAPEDPSEEPFRGRAGVFMIPRTIGGAPHRTERDLELGAGVRQIVFRLPLEPGVYPYSAELRSEDGSFSAARRGQITASVFGDWLSTSDLLIATSIEPRRPTVRNRGDLSIVASPDLVIAADEPIGVFFEVYGLAYDEEGLGRYTVDVQLRGERGLVGRVTSALGRLLPGGDDDPAMLSWEREIESGSERVPEWFTLQVPDARPGAYELTVTVTDRLEGTSFATKRGIEIR
jgi:GWxTD domain-containing protein